jgi:iron-sulfur cluster assembly protein
MGISISDRAKEELKKMDVGEGKFLRISVIPGGCSGMTYSAAVDETRKDTDEILFEDTDISVVAEAGTDMFLDGLTIDFSDDLIKRGFRFSNPNVGGSCGCGASFSG